MGISLFVCLYILYKTDLHSSKYSQIIEYDIIQYKYVITTSTC